MVLGILVVFVVFLVGVLVAGLLFELVKRRRYCMFDFME